MKGNTHDVIFRFVHSADLHLDSPFKGIRETEPKVAETLRRATFDAYKELITLCIDRNVDALLVAGDVFDSADRSLAAQIQFVEGLERLNKADIPAFVCHGNHDPLDGWAARLEMPANVHQFTDTAETVPINPHDPLGPVVCGVSYQTREQPNSLIPKMPAHEPSRFTIGLLHANVGASTEHEPYAPCTIEDLVATGYDYWALGHVHRRATLREQAPMVVYPGNTQGRSPNETGPRGVYVVDVDENRIVSQEFVPVDTVRWEQLNVPISGIEEVHALFVRLEERIEERLHEIDGRHLVYRIYLEGRGPIHHSLVRSGAIGDLEMQLNTELLAHHPFAFCTKIVDQTKSELDRDVLRQGKDFTGDFLALADQVSSDETLIAALKSELSPLYNNKRARKYFDNDTPSTDVVRGLLSTAENIALDLLVDDETAD